jgi:RHS repeat-associated protein
MFHSRVSDNQPPVAAPDGPYTVHRILNPLSPGVLANDSDPDGDPLFIGVGQNPTHGFLQFGQGGAISYTFTDGSYVGPDSFTYRVCDDHNLCSDYVTVTLNRVNETPVAVGDPDNDAYTVHRTLNPLVPSVMTNDFDPDDEDSISFAGIGQQPAHGFLQFGVGDAISYTVTEQGYVGPDSFTYRICDNFGSCSAYATVLLNVVNQTPIAANDGPYRVRGSLNPLIPNVMANDHDPDLEDSIDFAGIGQQPAHGFLQFGQGGAISYTMTDPGFVGSDSFTYRICDNLGACSTYATVTLLITGEGENDGGTSCNANIGEPINVTNGNMFLQQNDYQLSTVGFGINVARTYNSNSQRIGLFGRGWSTAYDESIIAYDNNLARVNQSDGRAIYFGRPVGTLDAFTPVVGDFHAQLTPGVNGLTLALKDGRIQQFSSAGTLLSLADRNGNTTALTYGGNDFLSSVTDAFGRVLTVSTNGNGLVTSISDPLGTVATYTYGGGSELLSVTYADNSAFHFSYDGNLRLTTVTDALGNIVESHTYDGQGRAVTSEKQGGVEHYTLNYVNDTETDVTDALGHVTKYFFDKSAIRNVVTRVEGLCSCGSGSQFQTWTYDNNLNLLSHSNSLNQTTTYTYDGQGNQLTMTDAAGTTTTTYNQFGQPLTVTDAMGSTTLFTYNGQGNPVSITDPLNKITSFTSDSRGQLLTITNARGKTTNFAYDATGNLITRTDALGHTTQFGYDQRGRLASATNALGHATAFAYDAVGRISQLTQADGTVISYEYDLAGRRTALTDAKGNRSTYAYDATYRLIGQTDAANQTTAFGYDVMSNLTSATDALSRTINYEYDDFNRLVKTTYPEAMVGSPRLFATVTYDAVGNVTQRTDTAGRVRSSAYDNLNRVVSTTDADNKTTTFEYDVLGRMTALVDALSQRYRFNYDAMGRLKRVRRGAAFMAFTYDAVGNRKHRIDYNGATTDYDYDALNRLKKINYPDTTVVTYTYDKLARVQTATNENGTIDFDYNKMNRLTNATDVFGQVVGYNYDPNGNRTKLSLNAAVVATYRYDVVNRLTKLLDSTGSAFTFDYDATSKLTQQKAPNNVKTSYQYDGLDRLTRLTDTKGLTTIADRQYQYNTASQITQITEPTITRNYSYDPVDRLTSASYTNPIQPNENYAYDSVGNRTSSQLSASYGYQPFNRLANTATASYTYDTNGNLVSKTDPSGTTQYAWDFENRLKQVTLPNGNTVAYKYDALGRRIQRTPGAGVSTNFIYDGHDAIRDLNSDGSTVDYLNGPGIDNKLRFTDSRLTTVGPLYFSQDHLGSTSKLTNSVGAVVNQVSYDGFGNSAGSSFTRYDYTGRERDPDTGLMYYRARWYDPQLGRFISEDPIGLAGGINQFTYVSNNPQNATDPSGLYEIDVHYYLTYYLAKKTGCFTDAEARLIADANQATDENDATKPGLGLTARQRRQNARYHVLHPGGREGVGSPQLWEEAKNGISNYVGLGRYLHYLQDSFSHSGYESSVYGHGPDLHYVDKTDSDVEKAVRMAVSTWYALRDYARAKKCSCLLEWSDASWSEVRRFAKASGGPDYREINTNELSIKRQILDVPWR